MEKIFIKHDEGETLALLAQLECKTVPAANEILNAYKALNMGSPDMETLLDISINNTKETEKKTIEDIQAEIKRLGIKNPTLKKSMIEGAFEQLDKIKDVANQYKHEAAYFRHISVNKGMAEVTESDKQRLKERFTLYVETEPGAKVMNLTKNAAGAINELLQFVETANNKTLFTSIHGFTDLFFNLDREAGTVNAKPLDFDFIAAGK